ncbi:MAG TPA: tetratricopeptide repeat-containing glycosyltransferase family protein [Pirellulales bacterium]|nr:tetratricopeptide repeat-containing glycosyltransferase family protein [Pirellulales bacterium]
MTGPSPTFDEPADFQAIVAIARAEQAAGRLVEAAAAYRRALAIRPDAAGVHMALGDVLLTTGRPDEAAEHFRRVLALQSGFFPAHNRLGILLSQQGQLDEAAVHLEQALTLRPDVVELYNNLAIVLLRQGKLVESLARFEQALALRPDYAVALKNMGSLLRSQGRIDDAIACYQRALAVRPDYAEVHYNLANALNEQGKFVEAIQRFERAVALRPDYAEALQNLGLALLAQLKTAEARQVFERLRTLDPDSVGAQVSLASCYLLEGDYERGWPHYEARLRMPGVIPQPNLPRWQGEPLAGRTLLLMAEQGLGDTIQFMRYARPLKQLGARVVLAAPAPLGRLIASYRDLDELFLLGSPRPLPRCDFYLPLLSVPGALGTTAKTIPCDVPYLSAQPDRVAHWRQQLAGLDGFRIGIAWQGSPDFSGDVGRSIALAHFAPLARVPGVRLVSLQKGFGAEQIATAGVPVIDLSSRLDESGAFLDTAAVMRNVDLVVTSDTAIPHLAGALGVPVWVALKYSPDWRFLLGRADSPWYPTMRLFRQTIPGDWTGVFERIAQAIKKHRSNAC